MSCGFLIITRIIICGMNFPVKGEKEFFVSSTLVWCRSFNVKMVIGDILNFMSFLQSHSIESLISFTQRML